MLASITPLGERGRGQRWGVTVGAFVAASVLAAAAFGALLGAVGALALRLPGDLLVPVVAAACLVCCLVDSGVRGLRAPSTHRQVDRRWLGAYRGWVYGAGFGAQLGAGVVTVVTSASTYLTFFVALASRSALVGGLVGATFGIVRALPLLTTRSVSTPAALADLHGRLVRAGPGAHAAVVLAQGCAGAALLVWAVAR